MKNQYWVGICPPEETVDYAAVFKQKLSEAIKEQTGDDRYGSVNAQAHITFSVFLNKQDELAAMEKFLKQFCSSLQNFTVRLNNLGPLGDTAYCLFPDEISKPLLVDLMRKYFKGSPVPISDVRVNPHMSIGRGLKEKQMVIAKTLFAGKLIEHSFICDNLVIRKFNSQRGQYDIYKRFPFGNPPDLKLF